MNPIVKIIVTFEYFINGWQIDLVYANGKIFDYTNAQFESNIKNQIQDRLSNISDYVYEEPIIEEINLYFSIFNNSTPIEFKYSCDT
tara:strand:- start:1054 stop:1314 length:261 start_codon:yes stop_codon:yes gene_type:complete